MVLIIVDMQKYYLDVDSSFCRFSIFRDPNSLEYLHQRCNSTVVPNIKKLYQYFKNQNLPVIFLKLCGDDANREDLHPAFAEANKIAEFSGYPDLYPTVDQLLADVIDDLRPSQDDIVFQKKTFSAFTATNLNKVLEDLNHQNLVFTGLATSQCVESTARDGVDRAYNVTMIEDAQADYTESMHHASLYSSSTLCNGLPISTKKFFDLQKI